MMMLDSGTFRHLAGRIATKYIVERREIKPFPVKTALGLAWITEECDLLIGPYLIERCLVNHNLNTTLLSEGLLSLEEPYWEFNRNRHGLDIVLGDGTRHQGHKKGVMYYLPQSLLDLKKEESTQGVTVTPNRAMEGTEEAEYYESPASNGDGKGDSPNRMMSPPESEAECDQRIKDWEINHGIRGNVGANESYAMIPLGMDANRFGGDFDSRFIYNIEEKLINMQRGDQEGDYRQVIWEAEDGDDDCMDTSEEESEAEESAEFEFNQYGTNIGGIKAVSPYAVQFENSYEKESKKARKEIHDNSSREKALE